MTEPDYDLIIIGGGIHGVGVAQAAAAGGHRTLLVEERSLAAGTSSRSSKLIHGGLRYLETLQLGLVRESLRERKLLLTIAPGLVRLVPCLFPVYDTGSRGTMKVRAGLSIYSLLAGLTHSSRFRKLPESEWPRSDGLRFRRLKAVFRYWEAQTDDRLLTEAVMSSACSLGAGLLCPARFVAATRVDDILHVTLEGESGTHELRTRALVNAGGPWVRDIAARITPPLGFPAVELVQGAHIVLEGPLHEGIYYTESPHDRRSVFVMPWGERVLVGTTETAFAGDPARVEATPEEVEYLRETFRHHFGERSDEVIDQFAGLRVLPGGKNVFSRRPRDTRLIPDDPSHPRLVTVVGGKLTTYRSTAQRVLRVLRRALPLRDPVADTAELTLAAPGPPAVATEQVRESSISMGPSPS